MIDDAPVSYDTSNVLTAVSPGAAVNPMTYPGNTLRAGSMIELEAWGTVSTSGSTPTILLGFYWGGTAGTVLAASTAVTLTNQAAVAWPWRLWWKGRLTAVGTAGSVNGIGGLEVASSLTGVTLRRIPETAGLTTVTLDTTVAKAVVVGATWGTSASTNILFCNGFRAGVWG
jgi:hypothetical protein